MGHHSPGRRKEATRLPPTAIAGQAIFSGCLARITTARHLLESLLPRSLGLLETGTQDLSCLLVFGEQRDGMTFFGGIPVRWGFKYHELMVAIPCIRGRRADGEYLFVSGMTCDFWPAVWNGNFYYGFKKRLAQMSWDGERFVAAAPSAVGGFCASVKTPVQGPAGALDWIRWAASLLVLGHRRDGAFVRSQFEWDFHETAVEAVALNVDPGPHFPELPLRGPLACGDAYLVRGMRWRLTWPDGMVSS
jgi:hypothetical protein